MTRFGLELKLNDEKLCRAGLHTDYYVVSCHVTAMMRINDDQPGVVLNAGGLDSVGKKYVTWGDKSLKKGDVITIEIIDDDFDEPAESREAESEEVILQQKIKHYHRLKEELKEHLNE